MFTIRNSLSKIQLRTRSLEQSHHASSFKFNATEWCGVGRLQDLHEPATSKIAMYLYLAIAFAPVMANKDGYGDIKLDSFEWLAI